MRLSLDALQVLDAIDRYGTFAAAAEVLHRVPSAITYSVQKLEQDLGVSVFDRDGHRARLTPAGQELLKEGRLLLEAASALECRVKRVATGWETELRIAVSDVFDWRVLLPALHELRRQAPDTRVRLLKEVYNGAWDALATGRADIAIGAPDSGPSGGGYITRVLGEIEFVFAVSPEHPLAAAAEPVPAAEIRRHLSIAAADSSRVLPGKTSGLQTGQPVLTLPDLQCKLEAQLLGLGVGFLPRPLALPHLESGALLLKRVEEPKPNVICYAAWRNQAGGKARQLLIDWIAAAEWPSLHAAERKKSD